MKQIRSIAIVAVALFSLASCQKMEPADKNSESEKIIRTITGEFSNDGTKTTLGDKDKPLWSVGDVIRVLNSSSYQDITIASGNIDAQNPSKITFSTTLTGMLYAVYPASATTMTSCSGNITYTIPAFPDGKFGSANICVASGDGPTGKSIYFSNATAVVEMTVKSGVVCAKLTAANKIAGDMTVTLGNKGEITGSSTTSLSSKDIFVSSTPSNSKYYMAVAPVVTGAVTITCNTGSKSGSVNKGTKDLAVNQIYAMNLSGMTINTNSDLTGQKGVLNGQEFVLIKAKYDGTNYSYLKWATQNLAVTASGKAKWKSTNYIIGDYFQWAASYGGYNITAAASKIPTNLVIYDSFTNKYAGGTQNNFTYKSGKSFSKNSAPYYSSSSDSYTKYTSDSPNLDKTDDVASIVLGGAWRMPKGGNGGEFKAMCDVTKWTWNDTDKGFYVTKSGENLASNKSNALLFFPATQGYGPTDFDFDDFGDGAWYWSSTLGSNLFFMSFFDDVEVNPTDNNPRPCGFSVRPVSD